MPLIGAPEHPTRKDELDAQQQKAKATQRLIGPKVGKHSTGSEVVQMLEIGPKVGKHSTGSEVVQMLLLFDTGTWTG